VVFGRRALRNGSDPVPDENQAMPDKPRGPMSTARWVWEWTKSILVAFSLFVLIRTFLVEAFRIPTGSMENTLLVGDFLLVNKAVYGAEIPGTHLRLPAFDQPHRGDIVVFVPPHEPDKNYVKRLVGLPGDELEMRHKVLIRNGKPLFEPYVIFTDENNDLYVPGMMCQTKYLAPGVNRRTYRPTRDNWGPLIVPPDKYFFLGDNRDDSEDSRYWCMADRSSVRGQPLFIYYSFDPSMPQPIPWLTDIRWTRIGSSIH
jgi:signal peptidase I